MDSRKEANIPTKGYAEQARPVNTMLAATSDVPSSGLGAVESMRSIGSSLNPLKGFSMRSFGKGLAIPISASTVHADMSIQPTDAVTDEKSLDTDGMGPPIERFVNMKEAKELNGFDVDLLLRDYQRLAGAFKALRAS